MNIAVFQNEGHAFNLTIHDANGQRWLTADDVGEAMGHSNIRNLIMEMKEAGEIQEGKHFCKICVQKSGKGNPNINALSLKGVIRLAMRSHAERAKQFRDWAETVLFDVMTTGHYETPAYEQSIDKKHRVASSILRSHLQVGKLLGVSVEMSRAVAVETVRREIGIDYSPLLIENKTEEKPLTATELGKLMNPALSGIAMNALLCERGFQTKPGKEWIPTEKGKPFSFVKPFKAATSEHTGMQLLWYVGVLQTIQNESDKAETTA